MAKTTRTFLLTAAVFALAVSGLCAVPPVGYFLLSRALAVVLVFPGLGQGRPAITAAILVAFAVALTAGAHVVFRWSGFGESRLGLLVCWGLAGGPAGVFAVLAWARLHDRPFQEHAAYAASWGMATALLAALLALAVTRRVPAAPRGRERSFHPRTWVLPALVAGWAVVWNVLPGEQPLLAWLPLSEKYFDQVAVVLATVAAGSLEGVLRRRLPVEGRPGRAFVLAWLAACAAPLVYAAVVAIDGGMRELLLAEPLSPVWVTDYLQDLGSALVAEPAQVAVPPLLIALVATVWQRIVPRRERAPAAPDPVRTDRRWSLVVAGAALALTYSCLAVTSRYPALTRRTFDEETPVMLRALALLAPPDPVLGTTVVVWSWTVAAAFGASAAVLVYVAVRGRLVRLFPASDYLVLVAALALAAALAWNAGGVIAYAVTGERPLGVSPAEEAAAFTAFVLPVFAALLFIVHSQAAVTRFARIVDLEGERAKLGERYRAWKEQVREHAPGRRERGLIAARAAGAALVLAVVAGAVPGFGIEVLDNGLLPAVPALSLAMPPPDNLMTALYIVFLAGLAYLGLMKANLRERRVPAWLALWGLSVVAGGLAALGPAGLQMGLVAGPFVVAGLVVTLRRKVLMYGAAVLVLVALVPLVRVAPAREQVLIRPATWQETRARLTIDASYPRAEGADVARVNAALFAPVQEAVEEVSRDLRANPAATAEVRSTYVVVRNDAAVISVRYTFPGRAGRAVNFDRAAGDTLTVHEIFAPAAFTPAGRRLLAGALRPLMPRGQDPRTVTADNERLLVNLGTGAVEFMFGRDYFCTDCAPFTVRVPRERLGDLLRR
ncbi:hypothetical protein ITP53_32170 [Nonomuraea sp. K274]|uniref:Uncharacterized protein n=1 Tax=Nonomuraea cypriaca TaxID=1187855 RepID=A0A931AEU0_9ACTN|nr:hypothetical protein [Nonomuraea cypriaca]MBF8190290.1 hypothetical protein [Nonomuraea cypriaca]